MLKATPPDNPQPDLAEAKRFLAELAPGTEKFTFQTFDDNGNRKTKKLARVLNGTLAEHADELVRLNAAGAGVFVTVNVTDLQGREIKNITSVRATFSDLDDVPLAPVQAARPLAHILVESSRDRWHAYWRMHGVALDEFSDLQLMLAAHFAGDKGVHDLPRVMRLPGFIHHKVKGKVVSPPFRTRIVAVNPGPLVTAAQLRAMCKVTVVSGLEAMMKEDAGKGIDTSINDALTIAEAKAALAAIDPDIEEPVWFEIACVLCKAFGEVVGFQLWSDWSTSKGEKRKLNTAGQLKEKFDYITSKSYNYNPGTLVHYATAADPNWRLNVLGPQTTATTPPANEETTGSITLDLATKLWGAGERVGLQWRFDGGKQVVQFNSRGDSAQWFDFTTMQGGNFDALLKLVAAHSVATPVLGTLTLAAADWAAREFPPLDKLLGDVLTTETRALFFGPTGKGKTTLFLAMACYMAANRQFLHWRNVRPARVLFVDGEQSRRRLLTMFKNEVTRLGVVPSGLYLLNHDDIPGWAPLNTAAGQNCINNVIEKIGGIDFAFFDNMRYLLSGDLKDGELWEQTLPWVQSLMARKIGQLWAHHTGHDESRSYGDKSKEWGMDVVAQLVPAEKPEALIDFTLQFHKARERDYTNHHDFADVHIRLDQDGWRSTKLTGDRQGKLGDLEKKFYEALCLATSQSGVQQEGYPATTLETWKATCVSQGLITLEDGHWTSGTRAKFANNKEALLKKNWIKANETMAWTLGPNSLAVF
jgi:hypothetical protein